MVTDKDKIEQCVLEMAGANGSVAVQTITYMMMDWLGNYSRIATIPNAKEHLQCIRNTAHHIAENPNYWIERLPGSLINSDNARFSEERFAEHYGGHDLYYINIGRVLKKLDDIYQQRFSITGALNYLHDVEKSAMRLRDQLENA